MVKRLPNWLKIGVQAGFGPNFTVEFEAEIPKKFGLAYCWRKYWAEFTAFLKVNLGSQSRVPEVLNGQEGIDTFS